MASDTQLQLLIDKALGDDEAARNALLDHACDRLLRLTRKMFHARQDLRRWEQTDDVYQNAMLRLHRALADVRPETVRHFFNLAALMIRRTLLDLAKHHLGPNGQGANHHTDGQPADERGGSLHQKADAADEPHDLAEAARVYLREKFLDAKMGVSGANFGVAETGTICIVESEGNGRMCTTLPPVLVSVIGIEKLVPTFADLEVFLQLLPRSSTGERMNPYTSLWTGVTPGDGPQELHIVLLDAGRTRVLADEVGRVALHCIRCSACLNVCPVYTRTGGHAYGSVYPGPIGAILTPQLIGVENTPTLPYASTLCGACYEVCPVKIDIPTVLLHLRSKVVEHMGASSERLAMRVVGWVFGSERRLRFAQRLGRVAQAPLVRGGSIQRLPGPLSGWTRARNMRPVARESFREWWSRRP